MSQGFTRPQSADIAAHEADTTNVHGIADTAILLDTGDMHESYSNILASRLPSISTITLTDGTGYFVYVGKLVTARTPLYVEFQVTGAGAGAQTAEVGLFSTPAAPNKTGQSLTKLVATGTVDDLTTTGIKRNTSALATSVPAGTHLWAGIRTAMSGSEPQIGALSRDQLQGHVLDCVGAGALTGAGPFSGAIVSIVGVAVGQHPELRVVFA